MFGKREYPGVRRLWPGLIPVVLSLLWSATAWSAPDHLIFAQLLSRYNHNGVVDYAGFKKEEAHLDAYLEALAGVKPDSLSRDDRFA